MISHDSTEAAARGYVLPYPHPVAQGACMSSADTAEDQRLDMQPLDTRLSVDVSWPLAERDNQLPSRCPPLSAWTPVTVAWPGSS
jgi:hypothetical protein